VIEPFDLLDQDQRSLLFGLPKRLIDTPASERCDNAKIGKMRSDRIDHRNLLTGEEMARTWFTRENSLPMPIDIGLGAAMGVVHIMSVADITGRGLPEECFGRGDCQP
jgi:hypothetical protein